MTKKIKRRNSNKNIFIPSTLNGNFIIIKEEILENLMQAKTKKKKYNTAIYMYLKIKLNESYTGKLKISQRDISENTNISLADVNYALKTLQTTSTDLKIEIKRNKTLITNNENYTEHEETFLKFEKNVIKDLIRTHVNVALIYTYICYKINIAVALSKGLQYQVPIKARELSQVLQIDKDIITKAIKKLAEMKYIKNKTMKGMGSTVYLKSDKICKEYVEGYFKEVSRYNEQSKPIYRTKNTKVSRYSEHKKPEKQKPKKDNKECKEPSFKRTSVKEPMVTLEALEGEVKNLQKVKNEMNKKLHFNKNLDGYKKIRSKFYNGNKYSYDLFYHGNDVIVKYGSYTINIDDYISYTRRNNKDSKTYIYSPENWKQSFIRNFNIRKRNMPNNFELRIKSYVKDIDTKANEEIPKAINKRYEEIHMRNKNKRQEYGLIEDGTYDNGFTSKKEKIEAFKNCYYEEYKKIDEELSTSIKNFGLEVNLDYYTDMFIKRIDRYIENNSPEIVFK